MKNLSHLILLLLSVLPVLADPAIHLIIPDGKKQLANTLLELLQQSAVVDTQYPNVGPAKVEAEPRQPKHIDSQHPNIVFGSRQLDVAPGKEQSEVWVNIPPPKAPVQVHRPAVYADTQHSQLGPLIDRQQPDAVPEWNVPSGEVIYTIIYNTVTQVVTGTLPMAFPTQQYLASQIPIESSEPQMATLAPAVPFTNTEVAYFSSRQISELAEPSFIFTPSSVAIQPTTWNLLATTSDWATPSWIEPTSIYSWTEPTSIYSWTEPTSIYSRTELTATSPRTALPSTSPRRTAVRSSAASRPSQPSRTSKANSRTSSALTTASATANEVTGGAAGSNNGWTVLVAALVGLASLLIEV